MLTPAEAVEITRGLVEVRDRERDRLDRIRGYLRDDVISTRTGQVPWLPSGVPPEVQRLAVVSRVNMIRYVVAARTQGMFVDGFRPARASEDLPAWDVWQGNRMDARQIGVHRAAFAYGCSYVTVLPGIAGDRSVPIMRGASPRGMTVQYGDDDDWPLYALERRHSGYRLIDDTAVHIVDVSGVDGVSYVRADVHGATFEGDAVVPVVRVRETCDLDDPVVGLVEPLIFLQDQINTTTFALLVAQHYGAFRQRYIVGWLAETEEQLLKASASKLWTFEDAPSDIQIGEFGQTDLGGHIASREATLRHMATVSQTPAHELLGQLVNLSADALAAAEASHRRALGENQTSVGEAWEQALNLAGEMMGVETDPMASVVWRDTESRSLAQVADALGKLVQMLGVPAQELWERIPGVTQQEVERWAATAAQGDAIGQLTRMLDSQSEPPADGDNG